MPHLSSSSSNQASIFIVYFCHSCFLSGFSIISIHIIRSKNHCITIFGFQHHHYSYSFLETLFPFDNSDSRFSSSPLLHLSSLLCCPTIFPRLLKGSILILVLIFTYTFSDVFKLMTFSINRMLIAPISQTTDVAF